MEAKELRIGNYVYGAVTECIVHTIGMFEGEYSCQLLQSPFDSFTVGHKLDEINPIPLTEQWLIDFGFKEHVSKEYKNNWLAIRIMNDDWNIAQWRGGNINYDLRYVHQLQNLFYCLTGKELIKPKDQ